MMDLNSDKIIRSLLGTLTQEEEDDLQLIIENDPSAREEYDAYSKLWEELKMIQTRETPQYEIKKFES